MIRYIAYALSVISLTAVITWLAMHEPALSQNTNAIDLPVSSLVKNKSASLLLDRTIATKALKAEHNDAATDRRLQKLEIQVQQLQQQLREQRNEVVQLARVLVAERPSDLEAVQDSHAPEPSAEELEQAERDREQQRLAHLEGVFDSQQSDPTWSQEAAQLIVSAAEQVSREASDSGTALVDVQCRASLCRLEMEAYSWEAIHNFSQMFPLQLGWHTSIYQTVVAEPNGSVTSIIYVSKDGQDLPAESNQVNTSFTPVAR